MNEIILEAHICDQRRSYRVTFEGPQAENMALSFINIRHSTHVIREILLFDPTIAVPKKLHRGGNQNEKTKKFDC